MSEAPILNQIHIQPEDRLSKITFMGPIEPDWDAWQTIADDAGADIDRCWTCGACDNGCPVSLATGRLRPQRNVRMAVYGMLDQLLALPGIWYCLSCRRCLQGCPNRVKPASLAANSAAVARSSATGMSSIPSASSAWPTLVLPTNCSDHRPPGSASGACAVKMPVRKPSAVTPLSADFRCSRLKRVW